MTKTTKKNNIEIMIKNDGLFIKLHYYITATKEEVDATKKYFQVRFSEKAGRSVPMEEIKVKPEVNELREATTYVTLHKNKPISPLLTNVPQPVLQSLVEKLNDCKYGDPDTITYAIQEIRSIIVNQKAF